MLSGRARRGVTLIELAIVLAVAGVLAALTWPSVAGAVMKSRRSEAMVALAAAQLAQERWRSEHPAYGSGAELALPARTATGLYRLEVVSADTAGYLLRATATGAQAGDTACQRLELSIDAATVLRRSGPAEGADNDVAANRRCWGG